MPRPQPRLLLGKVRRLRILASRVEKELVAGLLASDAAAVERVAGVARYERLAGTLAGLLYLGSDDLKAARFLGDAVAARSLGDAFAARWGRWGVWDHGFMRKHFSSAEYQLGLGFERLGVGVLCSETLDLSIRTLKLALSLALEGAGDLARAVEVARELEPEFWNRDVIRLVLADQYAELGSFEAILELTDGITNKYNYGALLCVYRGMAARQLGQYGTSLEALKEALKSEQRLPTIRFSALSERSRTHQAAGNPVAARRDLKRILAENASVPGIRERLEALGGWERG